MFGFLRSAVFDDPRIGALTRSRGRWRATVSLAGQPDVPIALSGNRHEPDQQALAEARELAERFESWQPAIEAALLEHRAPYLETSSDDDAQEADALLSAAGSGEVWSQVSLEFVDIGSLDGEMVVEFGMSTGWDEEHTLGARFRAGELVELCGSVLPP